MENTSEYKTKDSSNVTVLHSQNRVNSDIMKLKEQEDGDMEREMYTKTEIDLKLDKINSDVKHGFEKVDLKFDQVRTEMRDGFENMTLRMEKLLLEFKADTKKEQESNKKWLIGIAISIIGLLITAIVKFL